MHPITLQYTAGRDGTGHFKITGAKATEAVNIDGSGALPPLYSSVTVKFSLTAPGIDPVYFGPIDFAITGVAWDPTTKQYSIQATAPTSAADIAAATALDAAAKLDPTNKDLQDAAAAKLDPTNKDLQDAAAEAKAKVIKANLDGLSKAVATALDQSALLNLHKTVPSVFVATLTITPEKPPPGVASPDCTVQGYLVIIAQQSFLSPVPVIPAQPAPVTAPPQPTPVPPQPKPGP